jgi:nitrogen fixation protein NifU and related proteins
MLRSGENQQLPAVGLETIAQASYGELVRARQFDARKSARSYSETGSACGRSSTMRKYSAIVMSHFLSPRNAGTLDPPAVVGTGFVGGDIPAVEIYVRLEGGRVSEAKFKAFRCGATIAAASMLTELIQNRSVAECMALGENELFEALGGLPPDKLASASAAIAALRDAIAPVADRQASAG